MKRNIYLKTTPVEEARERYMEALGDPETRTETVRVIDALGRVTSDAVYAKYSSPLYNSAAMDGIAVISSRTEGASEASQLLLKAGEDYYTIEAEDEEETADDSDGE